MQRLSIAAAFVLFASCVAAAQYNAQDTTITRNGFVATLVSVGDDPAAISPLLLTAVYHSSNTFHFKITDPNNQRWEVPDVIIKEDPVDIPESLDYDVSVETIPFKITVTRKSNKVVVFESTSLVFHDQYIEIGTKTDKDPYIYGLGERVERLRLNTERTYTLFNTDHPTPELLPLYGSQPFYLEKRTSGSHAVLLLNSNAMDVVLTSTGTPSLTFKTVGGVIDLYVFVGPDSEQAIRQYHDVIGHARLHPYWILGFHQCRYGYKNIAEVEEVVNSFNKYNLPLDSMWVDIDYMDRYKIFTTDPVNYPQEQFYAFSQDLKEQSKRLFLIIDPGVKVEAGYDIYEDGLARGIYVKDPLDSSLPSLGKVWPRATAFPDFTNPDTVAFWKFHLEKFHNIVEYGGMWIDMNEIASFCDGRCKVNVAFEEINPSLFNCDCSEKYPPSKYNDVSEYFPGDYNSRPGRNDTSGARLDRTSLHMESKYYLGIEYDLHNMYGHFESKVTKSSYEELFFERSAVITRATFPGTGRYAGHWLGDNESTFTDLKDSIAGIINFNLFGIPLVGADVCGFIGQTTKELCVRWMQLGIFYTFYRNHNAIGEPAQEPYVFDDEATNINRNSIIIRYQMLPYFYTSLYKVHKNGGTMVRPLFFNYPEDKFTWDIDSQFMVNENILVTPVVTQGAVRVTGYFPAGHAYYDWYTGAVTSTGERGQNIVLDAPLSKIPIHIREASIVVLQQEALNSIEARKLNYTLAIAVGRNTSVFSGELYVDDGLALEVSEENSKLFTFTFRRTSETTFSVTSSSVGSYVVNNPIEKIVFYGLTDRDLKPSGLSTLSSSITKDGDKYVAVLNGASLSEPFSFEFVDVPVDNNDGKDEDDDDTALIIGLSVGFGCTALVAAAGAFYAIRNKRSTYLGI